MDLYISSNGWLAWTTLDPVCQPDNLGQKRYIIVGFLPSGQFCITTDSFESERQAQSVIANFDQQTVLLPYAGSLVKVFTCFDGSYWWGYSGANKEKYAPERIYSAHNPTHAAELVSCELDSAFH